MSKILDTKSQVIKIQCPCCDEKFEKEIIVSIYEPNIDIDMDI